MGECLLKVMWVACCRWGRMRRTGEIIKTQPQNFVSFHLSWSFRDVHRNVWLSWTWCWSKIYVFINQQACMYTLRSYFHHSTFPLILGSNPASTRFHLFHFLKKKKQTNGVEIYSIDSKIVVDDVRGGFLGGGCGRSPARLCLLPRRDRLIQPEKAMPLRDLLPWSTRPGYVYGGCTARTPFSSSPRSWRFFSTIRTKTKQRKGDKMKLKEKTRPTWSNMDDCAFY